MLSSDTVVENMDISSKDIPIALDSLPSAKCKVYAPGFSILRQTRISDFIVELVRARESVLDIVGIFLTKNFDVFGFVVINGDPIGENMPR